jgi:adenosine deaminase
MKKKDTFYFSKTPYAELHLHFGGSVSPRMIWHKVTIDDKSEELKEQFKDFSGFQSFFDEKRDNLDDYLKMHRLVEPLQTLDRLEYFIHRLMRGAYEFENLSYMEIRHCPYSRTNKKKDEKERIAEMRIIVLKMDEYIQKYSGADKGQYPIIIRQILCMHSQVAYTPNVNSAILDLAVEMNELGIVHGIDIAGGEKNYSDRYDEILYNFKRAKEQKLQTTAHIFETEETPDRMLELIQYLDRIGHGIQIPLKYPSYLPFLRKHKICLEVCPTTYFKCGTFTDHNDENFKQIFRACEKENVDIVIGTDNSGMHNVRLQTEFENLLLHEVIKYEQLNKFRQNAFEHAFGLTEVEKQIFKDDVNITIDNGKYTLEIKI